MTYSELTTTERFKLSKTEIGMITEFSETEKRNIELYLSNDSNFEVNKYCLEKEIGDWHGHLPQTAIDAEREKTVILFKKNSFTF